MFEASCMNCRLESIAFGSIETIFCNKANLSFTTLDWFWGRITGLILS